MNNLVECKSCGNFISIKSGACTRCGEPRKIKLIAILLSLFLGGIGIHRFYLGRHLSGIIYLLFCWTFIPAIFSFLEVLRYCFMSDKDFDAHYNQNLKINEVRPAIMYAVIGVFSFIILIVLIPMVGYYIFG